MNGRDSSGPSSKGHLNPEASPPIARYAAPDDLTDVVRHFWVPEWQLPSGTSVTARVLGYPALNLVVDAHAALLTGPTTVAGERVLEGAGWAVGVLLRPAATTALGQDAAGLVDDVQLLDEPGLVAEVAAAMEGSGEPVDRHSTAIDLVATWLRSRLGPVSEAGLLANEAVALIEGDPSLARVADLARQLSVTPRTLQRAMRRCTGFTPAEAIRRRRLQDAAGLLAATPTRDLSAVAQETGFADHAHLTRTFRATVHETPSGFRDRERKARLRDVHELARSLPEVTVTDPGGRPAYAVRGKSFLLFRDPRPDAVDPSTGERLDDVIVFWVADEGTKEALVEDARSPYFTTPHFRGHRSVLLRGSRMPELTRTELAELVQDAWLARAPVRLAKEWLASQHGPARY